MTGRATTARKGKTLTAPQALAETPMEMFATVYRACAQHGINPLQVNEMEVWEVASVLGVDMDDDSDVPGRGGSDGPPPPGALSRGRRR